MKIYNEAKIVLCDTPVGSVALEGEIHENGDVFIKSDANAFTPSYIKFDIGYIIEHDIEQFKALNARNDENHQVHIDTLQIHQLYIYQNFIRIGYVFDQYLDGECMRMCAGQLTHFYLLEKKHYNEKLFNECYSSDVCVYW